MRIVDWLARTTMLVLAALATLALIGSLASVSNAPIGDAFPGGMTAQDAPAPAPAPDAGSPPSGRSGAEPASARDTAGEAVVATVERVAAARDREVARWLKALTYAVIALAAIAAAGVVALVRVGGHLARLADR